MELKVNFSLAVFALIYLCSGALASTIKRVQLEDNEINQIGSVGPTYRTVNAKPESEQYQFVFPGETSTQQVQNQEIETSTNSEVEGEGLTDQPSPTGDRQGRTLHHFAQKFHFVEAGLQSALDKLLSLLFKPHHQNPAYVDYAYRKDGGDQLPKPAALLKPLVNLPQYLTSHPINFKKHLSNLQHSIIKRDVSNEDMIYGEDSRQAKTLHKIIPNFEANFNRVFRTIFPAPLFTPQQQQVYQGDDEQLKASTSSPFERQTSIQITNLMRMLPQIFNRRYGLPADQNTQNQPIGPITAGLQRLMAMLARPLIRSSPQYSS